MPLETATYTDDLVTTNPASSDGMNNADDHMRLIKSTIKNTIPGANGPITTATGGHQSRTSGTSTAPAFTFAQEPTLGFFRDGAGVMRFVGGALRGASPVGGLHMFLVEPVGLGKAATGTGHDYLELDGSTWPNASFPALAAHLNQGGSTFTLPNAYATGCFPRSRTATVAAGTKQSNTVGPHTHPDQAITTGTESADHTHSGSGTTSQDFPDHTHNYTTGIFSGSSTGGGAFACAPSGSQTLTSGGANARHQHTYSFTTGGRSSAHTHNATVPTPANTGTTETRPEAISFVFCVKT